MISNDRYKMLIEAMKKGADLSPKDYEDIKEYERRKLKKKSGSESKL